MLKSIENVTITLNHKEITTMSNQGYHELEVKFKISSTDEILTKIRALAAPCVQPVQLERNLRWDDPDRTLSKFHRVLRLRDNGGTSVLTFKAESKNDKGLADREEIETVVSDFENTRLILERLRYEIMFIYEKYRSIYTLNDTGLFVDHTPIGAYIEIEGPDEAAIRSSVELLGLNWEDRIDKSYSALFSEWKTRTGFSGRDMVFKNEE